MNNPWKRPACIWRPANGYTIALKLIGASGPGQALACTITSIACTLSLARCLSLLVVLFTALSLPLLSVAEINNAAHSPEADWIVTARPGDSVKSIASKYLAKPELWADLLRYNKIHNVNLLPPGTQIKIPISRLKSYPKSATFRLGRGTVWFRKAHTSSYIPALQGQKINIGDELKTLEGFALVKFADGSQLRIASQSIIIFNTLTHYGDTGMVDTRFRLNKGKINTRVSPRKGPAARYEVTTPSAVAAVRGTSFRMKVDNDATVTEVTEGSVLVSHATGQMRLSQGQGSKVSATGSPQRLMLLPPPQLVIPTTLTELPLSLSWPPVAGAATYIAELSAANAESLPLQVMKLTSPNLQLPALANGDYKLTIRAVDPDDIEGIEAEAKFKVASKALPAKLVTPLSKATLNYSQPLFRWQVSQSVTQSSLEIAADPEFKKLYTSTPFASQQSATSERPLAAGEYSWRIVTMAGRDYFAWSKARAFTIQDILEQTHVIAVNYLEDRAKVFWKSVEHAENYLVQLSEDEFFNRLIHEDKQKTTSALLRLTPGRTYWVRVKGMGNKFYSSNFGKPQLLKIQH